MQQHSLDLENVIPWCNVNKNKKTLTKRRFIMLQLNFMARNVAHVDV